MTGSAGLAAAGVLGCVNVFVMQQAGFDQLGPHVTSAMFRIDLGRLATCFEPGIQNSLMFGSETTTWVCQTTT